MPGLKSAMSVRVFPETRVWISLVRMGTTQLPGPRRKGKGKLWHCRLERPVTLPDSSFSAFSFRLGGAPLAAGPAAPGLGLSHAPCFSDSLACRQPITGPSAPMIMRPNSLQKNKNSNNNKKPSYSKFQMKNPGFFVSFVCLFVFK